jgi:NADPH:quinone reductase
MQAVAVVSLDRDASRATAVIDLPEPQPGPGQVRIRVAAVGLNPVDWKLAESGHPRWSMPHILGLDAAGVVEAVGPAVAGWRSGDRVAWHGNLSQPGVFARYALADAHVLAGIPASVSFEAAAAVPCAGMTAYQGLFRKVKIDPTQTLLVQGAAGGVGGFAVQLGKASGARVIALASAAQADRVRRLGADVVLDRRQPDLAGRVREANGGRGADVLVEVANPGDARISLALLAYNGHLVSIDPLPVMEHVPNYTYAVSIHEVSLGGAYLAEDRKTQEDFPVMLSDLLERVASGSLDPLVERVIKFGQIPEALAQLRRGELPGKTVASLE